MAALYMVASAIVQLIPYAVGTLVIIITFTGIQRWLSDKDDIEFEDTTKK